MNQRAEIINRIAKAASLDEQVALVAALDAYDRNTRQATASANSIDLAGAVVEQTLRPVAVHERSTIATDWLGSVEASLGGENAQSEITVEAAMWYRRLSPEVRADNEEFAEQARGMARRTASKYGEQAEGLAGEFLSYVSFLRSREAASGLPQVQQIVDSHEQGAPNPLNPQVFDNFAPEVDPINSGVSGTETSERNPLLAEIEGNSGTQVAPADPVHHDTAPVVSQASVAINHFATLDDFRAGGQFHQAASEHCKGCGAHVSHCAQNESRCCVNCSHGKKEAASGLPQVQQTVDAITEQPAPTPLDPEVAFPWDLNEQGLAQPGIPSLGEGGGQGGPAPKQASFRRRAAYVAGLMAREPHSLSQAERAEVIAFTALLKTADQWTEGAPQPTTTPVANQDQTVPTEYSPADGYAPAPQVAEGRMPPGAGGDRVAAKTHHCKHDGHIYTDDGDSCTKCGMGKSASLRVEANDQVYCHGAGTQVGTTLGGGTANCPNCQNDVPVHGGTGEIKEHVVPRSQMQANPNQAIQSTVSPIHPSLMAGASLRVSASFTSPVEQADPEFAKGYKYAAKWTPRTRLVTTGSAAFEAGLYAGISDSPAQQSAWVQAHRTAARKFRKAEFTKRLAVHREFTKQASRHLPGVRVVGSYLRVEGGVAKTAATTTELNTASPATSPSPTGSTPINGPGTPGPLAGGMDPAAPGGPSPYQGAEPFGAPVVGNPGSAHGIPTAIDATPGGPVDQASLERLSPQTLAFRKKVQSSLLQTRKGK